MQKPKALANTFLKWPIYEFNDGTVNKPRDSDYYEMIFWRCLIERNVVAMRTTKDSSLNKDWDKKNNRTGILQNRVEYLSVFQKPFQKAIKLSGFWTNRET